MRLRANLAGAFAILAFAPAIHAGPGSVRSFAILDTAPVWVVGTVEEVAQLDEVPPGQRRFPWGERRFEAHLLVWRVFFHEKARTFEPGARIAIRYTNPEGQLLGGGGSGPPAVIELRKGQTILVPLNRAAGGWSVSYDQAHQPVVAVIPGEPRFAGPPRNGSSFAFRELANVLAHGDPVQRSQAAVYLMGFGSDVPAELPRLLAAAFGRNDDVWLEAGCAFLGIFGAPRNNPELVYGEASPPFPNMRRLITWILWKGDRRDYPNRLIRALVRNTWAYPWGASMTLVDFKDSTVLIDELNAAMRRNASGSVAVAGQVVKAGQRAVLPEALELSQRIISRTDATVQEMQPAVELVLNYGDDRQFGRLVAALAQFKRENEFHYRDLWSAAAYGPNPRTLRLAAVMIDDRRPSFGTLRYCDVAAGEVQRIGGVNLGISQQMTQQERERAVGRAAVWLAAHR